MNVELIRILETLKVFHWMDSHIPLLLFSQSFIHPNGGNNLAQVIAPLNGREMHRLASGCITVYSGHQGLLYPEPSSDIMQTITWGKHFISRLLHRRACPFRGVPRRPPRSAKCLEDSHTYEIIPYQILNKEGPFCPEVWIILHLLRTL